MSNARRPTVHAVPEPTTPSAVLEHIGPGDRPHRPAGQRRAGHAARRHRGAADGLDGVRVHQMHALHDRPLPPRRVRRPTCATCPTSCPTSPGRASAPAPSTWCPTTSARCATILKDRTADPLVLAAASPPDRHGYFSLGLNADYVASFIGRARFFLEANHRMPRTFGRNQIHVSQVVGWIEADYPLGRGAAGAGRTSSTTASPPSSPSGSRTGDDPGRASGPSPTPSCRRSADHRDLGVHTELHLRRGDGPGRAGVVTGVAKEINRTKTVGTFALGTQRLYDFLDENTALRAAGRCATSTTPGSSPRSAASSRSTPPSSVDLLGQCASETVGGAYYSSSGGQADFARGAMYSEGGQGFVVLHSTARDGTVSKIVPQLARRRRRHDAQEHRRQGRHRVGRGRAPRPLDPRAGRAR